MFSRGRLMVNLAEKIKNKENVECEEESLIYDMDSAIIVNKSCKESTEANTTALNNLSNFSGIDLLHSVNSDDNCDPNVNVFTNILTNRETCNSDDQNENIDTCERVSDGNIDDAGHLRSIDTISSKSLEISVNSDDMDVRSEDENVNTPIQKKSRKRVRSEKSWKRNVIKSKRNKGEEYINWRGNMVSKRIIKTSCTHCRLKCKDRFSENERMEIFSAFWDLGDIDRQRDFILNNVEQQPIKRSRVKRKLHPDNTGDISEDNSNDENENNLSRRSVSYYHYFILQGNKERVCQTFFLNTLSISNQMVKTAFTKKLQVLNAVENDKRGKTQCNNKLPESVKQSIIDHINLFPRIDSHYCRKDSAKGYLDTNLNIVKMYNLYIEFCKEKHLVASKLSMYRHIFNTRFNLDFFTPKKDLCDLCEKYKNSNEAQKNELQDIIDDHLLNKVLAREAKDQAKKRSQEEEIYCAGVYDLQQVLQSPHLEVSQLYYKRKMSSYNLTVYDLNKKSGHCFMWDETKGQRGSNEIASCVHMFIDQKVREGKKEICFFSDNCGGQNLNRNIAVMYLYSAITKNIKITHCFLEKGHTQNEGDSVHSTIERASKHVSVYVPDQWYTLARTACRRSPYNVIEMKEFYDFQKLRSETCNQLDKDDDREQVKWQKIRILMVDPQYPNTVFVKYTYRQEIFKKINIESRTRKKLVRLDKQELQILYNSSLPISTKKFKDLEALCNNRIIPTSYHEYYKNLKHSDNIKYV